LHTFSKPGFYDIFTPPLTLSHISEMYGGYNISNLKYIINLYKKHGKKIFEHKEIKAYK